MEFEGVVMQVLPAVKGTSARGEWSKQDVIFEQSGEFGRKVCVGFWGDKAQDAAGLVPGEKVRVSANVESREYNGRWYTDVRAWKMERAGATGAATHGAHGAAEYDWGTPARGAGASYGSAPQHDMPTPSSTDEPVAKKEEFDDLPF